MPYNCEECGELGARMNSRFEIRLCEKCSSSQKYKLICKSVVMNKYKLTDTELNNLRLNNLKLKQYYGINPHWRSGPPMILFLETDIFQLFLQKHHNTVVNILNIHNPDADMANAVGLVLDWIEENKNKIKQNKYEKLLKKYNVELENLPQWAQENLDNAKSFAEYSRTLDEYLRFEKLYGILCARGLKKYINHPISHAYIYPSKSTDDYVKSNPDQIPNLIKYMLNKKKILKKAIRDNKLPVEKYSKLYAQFINSYDTSDKLTISNDLDTLVTHIKNKEYRINSLEKALGVFGLELRLDSVLCAKYLKGDDTLSPEQIADMMDQMRWFFTHTYYSKYSREYDRDNRESKYYERDLDSNLDSDSDSDSDSDLEFKFNKNNRDHYNKVKSNYVKKRCLTEWIIQGKKFPGPPDSLNWAVDQIEEKIKLDNERDICRTNSNSNFIQIKCANPLCSNHGSRSCIGLKCGLCCDGVDCNAHNYKQTNF